MQSSNSHSSTLQADNDDSHLFKKPFDKINPLKPLKSPIYHPTASSHPNDSRNKNKRKLTTTKTFTFGTSNMQSSNSHSSTFQADNEDSRRFKKPSIMRNSLKPPKSPISTASSHPNDSRNKNKRKLTTTKTFTFGTSNMQSSNSHSSTFQADNEDSRRFKKPSIMRNSLKPPKSPISTASSHPNDSRNKNKRKLTTTKTFTFGTSNMQSSNSHSSTFQADNEDSRRFKKPSIMRNSLKPPKSPISTASSHPNDSRNKNKRKLTTTKTFTFGTSNMQSSNSHSSTFQADNEDSRRFKKPSSMRNSLKPPKSPISTASSHPNDSRNKNKRKLNSSHDSCSDDKPKPFNDLQTKTEKKKERKKFLKKSNSSSNRDDKKVRMKTNGTMEQIPKQMPAALNLAPHTGSIEQGKNLFGVLIRPIPVQTFMEKYWEQKPVRVPRNSSDYYKDLISTAAIDKMLRENHVEFTKNIDITQYKDGVRETLNPAGRAMPPCIWHHYGEGCSIRILNPQTFLPVIHSLNATLQEYFQCMVGANVYLTPKNSQGFAPHYDDIEAFVLQIEGKKRWRVYQPSNRHNILPRESSKNFDQDEIGEPCLDVILEAGDLLYFPRGYIHQATTIKNCHSLHITVSVYQKQTYGDLLEILIPMAMKEAISKNVDLRRGLPINIWQRLGLVNSDNYDNERDAICKQILSCFDKVCRYVRADSNMDNSVDQMALRYQHDALPPKLTPEEELCTIYSSKAMVTESGVVNNLFIEVDTKIRLIRANVVRMVRHGDEIRVYYSSENSKEYHGFEENFLVIVPADAPAVEVLIKAYPGFITPDQLQLENIDRNLVVAQYLWEKGILMTEEPLT